MEQEKRGLSPYDDKRYLLADMPNGQSNPNTHAYGHRDLVTDVNLLADHPKPGAELVIRQMKERFKSRHARFIRCLQNDNTHGDEEPDGGVNEFSNDQRLMAKLMADARPGRAIRMGEFIGKIIARENLERSVSPTARMLSAPNQQRSGRSGLNSHLPPHRHRIDSFDEKEPERSVWPPRRPHLDFDDKDYELEDAEPKELRRRKQVRRRGNPFLDADVGVDRDTKEDEQCVDENNDYD